MKPFEQPGPEDYCCDADIWPFETVKRLRLDDIAEVRNQYSIISLPYVTFPLAKKRTLAVRYSYN